MRQSSVRSWFSAAALAAAFMMPGGSSAYALDENKPKRTIIESLDDAGVQAQPVARVYDYSVTSEVLPAIPGVVSQHAPDDHGWETVVEARALSVAAPAQVNASIVGTWLAAFMVLAGTLLVFWKRLPSLSALKVAPRAAEAGLSSLSGMLRAPFHRRGENGASAGGDKGERQSQGVAGDDEEFLNQGLDQIDALFGQVEQVVIALRDGSPLRDALLQELRLIQHRIGVTKAAASSGDDPPQRVNGRCRVLARELDRVSRIADSAAASVRDPRDRLGIPQTPSEAYALLGVNPDVTQPVLKKLVDALRMTWHPDHARDESDRLLREERIKQINIAWDLINAGR